LFVVAGGREDDKRGAVPFRARDRQLERGVHDLDAAHTNRGGNFCPERGIPIGDHNASDVTHDELPNFELSLDLPLSSNQQVCVVFLQEAASSSI
jgi:hypothetical protein